MIHRYCFLVIVVVVVAHIVLLLLLLLLFLRHHQEHTRQVVVVDQLRLATLHPEVASLESRGCETVILRRGGGQLSIDLHSIASGQLLCLLQQPIEVFCQ